MYLSMEATLKFSLPEEEELHIQCVNGPLYASALHDFFYGYLRGKLKYSDLTEEEYKIYEDVKQAIVDEFGSRGIEF